MVQKYEEDFEFEHNNDFENTEDVTDDDAEADVDAFLDDIQPMNQRSTTIKKKKKNEIIFNVGDKVIYRKKQATVLFGPYEKNYKQVYELQMEDGSVTPAISVSIKKI